MHLLKSAEYDPAWNLAAEEYLLKQTDLSVCFIYRNRPSIVVGRNQHLWSEVNVTYLQENPIGLFRRISGGGAVYHDEGNLNVAFIENGHSVRFDLHRSRICRALRQIGIPAEPGPRSDIRVDSMKVSGNAATVSRNRVMHHGTLLYAANLDALEQALSTPSTASTTSGTPATSALPDDWKGYRHKGVASVRSQVMNLNRLYKTTDSIDSFQKTFSAALGQQFNEWKPYQLTHRQQEEIAHLRDTKYVSREWILGTGPAYKIERTLLSEGFHFSFSASVSGGRIRECRLTCSTEPTAQLALSPQSAQSVPLLPQPSTENLEQTLIGCWHHPDELSAIVRRLPPPVAERLLNHSVWLALFF